MRNRGKGERGITLVALIITIIIIIILSSITMNMVLGDNGLIKQAEDVRDRASNMTTGEGIKMNDLLSEYANMMNGEVDFPDNIIQGTIEFGEITWSNRQASITVSTNTSYYIEYQVNATTEGEWIRIENNGSISELKHGDTVYARLTDGINVGDYASASILDEIPPKVEIQVAETTNTSIKVNVIASDEESGLATTDTYTYYLNNEQKASNTEASYNYTGLTAGTSYTLKVVVKDEAGNETEASIEVSTTQLYTVTYNIDSGNTQTQQFSTGESVITGLNFTPSKSGYTFVGWREDTTASSSVLSSKTMETSNMTLYAVFSQNVTVTKYNGSSSATTETKAKYYNNGNAANPSFTLSQNGLSGWTAAGWTTSTSATGSTAVNNGGSVTLSSNATYYGKYTQTITLSYSGNGATGGSTASQTGTRYYNSAGNYSNPSFTLRSNGFTRTNYSFVNWAMGSASGTKYNAGATVTLSANTTFYATWKSLVERAFTFSSDSNHVDSSTYRNARYIQFGTCGYVGTGLSIQNDAYGNSIRLVTSRAGKLRFVLNAQNYTGANLKSNCAIQIDGDFVYAAEIQPNQSVSINQTFYVASGIIINIGNNGRNGDMWVKAGSYIEWVN